MRCLRAEPGKGQREAILHVSGPAMVLAGPGSGKTFTILQRINHLIQNCRVSPPGILTVTFTRAAALQMQQRFPKMTGQQPLFGTLHGICYRILQESGTYRNYSLISENQKRKLAENTLFRYKTESEVEDDSVLEFLDAVSCRKNTAQGAECRFLSPQEMESCFQEYQALLEEQRLLDFDDMVHQCHKLLSQNRKVCHIWQSRFSHILVDEFQDINSLQYQVIRLLSAPRNNLFIVGDDDQSIYGFRGAAPGIMKQFTEDFPNAPVFRLQENYRSGSRIVELAGQVIAGNTLRFAKEAHARRTGGEWSLVYCETRKQQEERLLQHIRQKGQGGYEKCALILRTNREVLQYACLLKKAGIPVREIRTDKDDRFRGFVCQDLQAFLRFCREGNHRGDFLKIMNKPNRYLTRQALTEEKVTAEEVLEYYPGNRRMRAEISLLFQDLERASLMPAHLAVKYFASVMGYDRYLQVKAPNPAVLQRWREELAFFQNLFREMKEGERMEDFLAQKEKERKDGQTVRILEGVHVITMHMAKGLEYDCVFLPDVNEGIIPGPRCITAENIEEERRLLYVAITRAKDCLYLYYTGERNRKLSRFLENIRIPPP